jgi:hypothetical protein
MPRSIHSSNPHQSNQHQPVQNPRHSVVATVSESERLTMARSTLVHAASHLRCHLDSKGTVDPV